MPQHEDEPAYKLSELDRGVIIRRHRAAVTLREFVHQIGCNPSTLARTWRGVGEEHTIRHRHERINSTSSSKKKYLLI